MEEIKKKKGRPKKEKILVKEEPVIEEIVVQKETMEDSNKDLIKLENLGFPLNFIESIYNIFIGKKWN